MCGYLNALFTLVRYNWWVPVGCGLGDLQGTVGPALSTPTRQHLVNDMMVNTVYSNTSQCSISTTSLEQLERTAECLCLYHERCIIIIIVFISLLSMYGTAVP